jgi:Na+/H+-translocating membrane pyrophosphatase
LKRIHIVALIAGLAADLIGSIIVSAAVTFVFIAVRGAGQPSQAIIETLETDPLFLSIGFIIGIAFTLLGAYIVARMSRPHSVLNTLVFGIISTLLGIFRLDVSTMVHNPVRTHDYPNFPCARIFVGRRKGLTNR